MLFGIIGGSPFAGSVGGSPFASSGNDGFGLWTVDNGTITADCPAGFSCGSAGMMSRSMASEPGLLYRTVTVTDPARADYGSTYNQNILTNDNATGSSSTVLFFSETFDTFNGIDMAAKQVIRDSANEGFLVEFKKNNGSFSLGGGESQNILQNTPFGANYLLDPLTEMQAFRQFKRKGEYNGDVSSCTESTPCQFLFDIDGDGNADDVNGDGNPDVVNWVNGDDVKFNWIGQSQSDGGAGTSEFLLQEFENSSSGDRVKYNNLESVAPWNYSVSPDPFGLTGGGAPPEGALP